MVFYENWLAKLILFGSYNTIMFFGLILTKESYLTAEVIQHEKIHVRQYLEVLILFLLVATILSIFRIGSPYFFVMAFFMYYIIYGIEWFISFTHHLFSKKKKDFVVANGKAYKNSAMEMEAYVNESEPFYLEHRRLFSFIKYYGLI